MQTTLKTPGIFSASDVSIFLISACDTSACTNASRSVPSGICSAPSAP